MHTVELLEQALETAQRLGYGIRQEWLGGTGGGACEFGGKKWLFVDLALNADEQLEQVAAALKQDPGVFLVDISPNVAALLEIRKAA